MRVALFEAFAFVLCKICILLISNYPQPYVPKWNLCNFCTGSLKLYIHILHIPLFNFRVFLRNVYCKRKATDYIPPQTIHKILRVSLFENVPTEKYFT